MLVSYHIENYDEVICDQMDTAIKWININIYQKTKKKKYFKKIFLKIAIFVSEIFKFSFY